MKTLKMTKTTKKSTTVSFTLVFKEFKRSFRVTMVASIQYVQKEVWRRID